jgi:Bacterial PH domain
MPTSKPRIVEWYRADPWPHMRRVLLIGPTLVTLGGIVVSVSFVTRQTTEVRVASALAGFVLVAGGALFTMLGMHRILRDDLYLSLRTDGVVIQSSGREELVAWESFYRARWDTSRRELVIERDDGEPIIVPRPFAGIDGLVLARRIEATKRRVAMNLLV